MKERGFRGKNGPQHCLVGPAGCEPLVGRIVMAALDLIADPHLGTLTPRPESPDRPIIKMKREGSGDPLTPALAR